jgi:hypothetical protein
MVENKIEDIINREDYLQPKPSGARENNDLKLFSMWRY